MNDTVVLTPAMSAAPLVAPDRPSYGTPVVFAPRPRDFLRLIVRGAFLQLITFGFYRFWLTTDIRRHLWSHTSVDGDSLEYTGRATELLIGFLIALAILAPIYLAYFLIGVEAERLKAFASIPLFFLLYVFGHFAIYRARRYRLSRTVWRGVRFWADGSGFAYAGRVLLWSPLVLLTFGLALPWRAASLERYKMRHTHFGDQTGSFESSGGRLFSRIWWIIAVLAVAVVGAIATLLSIAPSPTRMLSGSATGAVVLAVWGPILLALLMLPIYRAIEWRWWADGVRLGPARLQCELSRGALLMLYVKTVFVSLLVAIGVGVVLFILWHLLGGAFRNVISPEMWRAAARGDGPLFFLTIIGVAAMYLAFLLAIGVVQKFYLQYAYWREISHSLAVTGLAGLSAAAHSGALTNALGEGLADGLDVAGF